MITFKGGEAAGTPGGGFQVLDVQDRYAWQQVGKTVSDFRRTLIAVDTAGGRPYALDLFKLRGGKSHTLFNSAWAERVEQVLPATVATAENLEKILRGGGPGRRSDRSYFQKVRSVEHLGASGVPWELTWKTDLAAFAPRQADGTFVRPIPEDDGKVRLRLFGFDRGSAPAELISAKGPWLALLNQALPEGKKAVGVVGFEDARDFLIEHRVAGDDGKELESLFLHVIEGFRDGEASIIKSVGLPATESVEGAARDIVAVRLNLTDGTTDTVLYQSAPGTVRLPDGVETDARYALIRRGANGKVQQLESCRGSFVRGDGLNQKFPGDLAGETVDIIGDLIGTRQESALILKTTAPWPEGEALKGRQLLVTFESDRRDPGVESYRIDKVTNLADGQVRVDLQDHAPFIVGWHDVHDLPGGKKTGTLRTTRPLVLYNNSPWYHGMSVWFPEKQRHYTIQKLVDSETLVIDGPPGTPDLAEDGIAPGDWFVIYGIRPGLKVNVASEWHMNGETN